MPHRKKRKGAPSCNTFSYFVPPPTSPFPVTTSSFLVSARQQIFSYKSRRRYCMMGPLFFSSYGASNFKKKNNPHLPITRNMEFYCAQNRFSWTKEVKANKNQRVIVSKQNIPFSLWEESFFNIVFSDYFSPFLLFPAISQAGLRITFMVCCCQL